MDEMIRVVPMYNSTNKTRKRRKQGKPYWNDDLQNCWNEMRAKERQFLKYIGNNQQKRYLRSLYIESRNKFDKLLRQTERAYRQLQAVELEEISTSNPTEFWRKIKSLGPRTNKTIPLEVIENDSVISEERRVFEKWRTDFKNLYNRSENSDFDDVHYDRAKLHKQLLEMNMQDPLYESNNQLNGNITVSEISNIVMQAKKYSSCGFDNIPYDVLKNAPVIVTLQKLFQFIFDCSIIPSLWRKAIICPILKDQNTDKRIPLNYRGISLLSCISKLYTSFVNKRVTKYLDDNQLLADEQNGFRSNHSCEDHIFTLHSIIQNNPKVFSAFIDLKKCFDFIDREMLLYKLLLHKIDGKVYNSIRNIYANSLSCIRINNKLTDWFQCETGVKQGCPLSPTLFAIFANDLVKEINDLNLGIKVGDTYVSILMYSDDIVLLADSEGKLQTMLNTLHNWCKRWRVLINTSKSKCMHFRRG